MVGEGHAPLWRYFARLRRQTSPFRPPKGVDPGPRQLSPAKRRFRRDLEGTMIAVVGPDVMVGEVPFSPSWQYFSPPRERQAPLASLFLNDDQEA